MTISVGNNLNYSKFKLFLTPVLCCWKVDDVKVPTVSFATGTSTNRYVALTAIASSSVLTSLRVCMCTVVTVFLLPLFRKRGHFMDAIIESWGGRCRGNASSSCRSSHIQKRI